MNDVWTFQILTAARLARGPDVPPDLLDAWRAAAYHVGRERGRLLLHAWPDREAARLMRNWPEHNGEMPALRTDGEHVSLDSLPLGRIVRAYRVVVPTEVQVRLAYEALTTRFLEYLAHVHHIAVLHEGAQGVQLFIPEGREASVERLWEAFLEDGERGAFSAEWLRRSFVDVMNVIQLSDRGIGTPQVTIADLRQRDMLVGWMLASMRFQQWNLIENHEVEIARLEREDAERNASEIRRREASLAKNIEKYGAIFRRAGELIESLRERCPGALLWLGRPRPGGGNSLYTRNGMSQFSTDPAKLSAVLDKVEELMDLTASDVVKLRPLLVDTPPMVAPHGAGDAQSKVCYACGREVPRGAGSKATKLVLASPGQSQRRQSASSPGPPNVCDQCAAIATLSPFKESGNVIITEWRSKEEEPTTAARVRDLARMLVMSHLRIQVGRLVLIGEEERAPQNPLRERFGKVAYAMLKLAEISPETVLKGDALVPCLHIEGKEIALETRRIEALHHLLLLIGAEELGALTREPLAGAMSGIEHAIRAMLDDLPYQALYRIARSVNRWPDPAYIERVNTLLERFIRRAEAMEQTRPKAQLYRDVAALTGLLVPFISSVEHQLGRNTEAAKRAVQKLIEGAGLGPNVFSYLKARTSEYGSARLADRPENHFTIGEALRLLEEIGVDVKTRRKEDDQRAVGWDVYPDDVAAAYAHVFERYTSERQQKELTTELKYSLAARFPQYFYGEREQ